MCLNERQADVSTAGRHSGSVTDLPELTVRPRQERTHGGTNRPHFKPNTCLFLILTGLWLHIQAFQNSIFYASIAF